MYALTVESSNLESFKKVLAMLEQFRSDDIHIIKDDDFKDLQLIKDARKTRDAKPLEEFLKSVDSES